MNARSGGRTAGNVGSVVRLMLLLGDLEELPRLLALVLALSAADGWW